MFCGAQKHNSIYNRTKSQMFKVRKCITVRKEVGMQKQKDEDVRGRKKIAAKTATKEVNGEKSLCARTMEVSIACPCSLGPQAALH